jgi:hypothetical protein
MVATLTRWACEHGLTEANLTILAIDPPPSTDLPGQPTQRAGPTRGLVISTIHLGAHNACGHIHTESGSEAVSDPLPAPFPSAADAFWHPNGAHPITGDTPGHDK